jgi:hypothetical protein
MTNTTQNTIDNGYLLSLEKLKCRNKILESTTNHKMSLYDIEHAMEEIFSPEFANYKFDVSVSKNIDAKGNYKSLNLKSECINNMPDCKEYFIQDTELLRFYTESNTFVFCLPRSLAGELYCKKWGSKADEYAKTYGIPWARASANLWKLSDLKYSDERIEFYRIVCTVIEHAVEKCKPELLSLN